jgi:hypothetical protein
MRSARSIRTLSLDAMAARQALSPTTMRAPRKQQEDRDADARERFLAQQQQLTVNRPLEP